MFSVNVVSVNVVSVNTLSANVALCAPHVFLCLGAKGEGASAETSTPPKAAPKPPSIQPPAVLLKMKRERVQADEASIACMRCVVSVAVFSVKTNHVKSDSVVNNA